VPPEDVLSPTSVRPCRPDGALDPTVASGQTVASGRRSSPNAAAARVGSLQLALAVVALLAGRALPVGLHAGRADGHDAGHAGRDQALFAPFWDTWDSITRSYVGPVDQKKLVEGAIDGLIKALGDRSRRT